MRRHLLLHLLATCLSLHGAMGAEPVRDADLGVGSWIWDQETHERQKCRFFRSFEIPAGARITVARLRITADNSYTVYLDGQPVGQDGDWYSLIDYDLSKLLPPGRHVLAVSAVNDFDRAGLIASLYAETASGGKIWIPTDTTWKIVPPDFDGDWKEWTPRSVDWQGATVLGNGWWKNWPGIYQAARTEPVVVRFWEQRWFQIGSLCIYAVTAAACLYLLSRLVVRSQLDAVIRRERSRIAADLHDDIGGQLTQQVLLGETIRHEVPADAWAAEHVDSICGQSRDLVRGMNENIWLINSQRDNLRDFASYLCKSAEAFAEHSPVRCRFDIQKDLPALPCDLGVRRNLFLAVKEALNNVLKHSGATEMTLRIRFAKKQITVTIADNGRGLPASNRNPTGNGLTNMRSRAADAGGHFSTSATPGGGCTVKFRGPLVFTKSCRKQKRT